METHKHSLWLPLSSGTVISFSFPNWHHTCCSTLTNAAESPRPSCGAVNSLLGPWGRDTAGLVPGTAGATR